MPLILLPVQVSAAGNEYATRIGPLLADRCGSCHGDSRQKGDLALNTPEAIHKGGEHGPVLVAGKPAQSEIVRRLRLPIDDDDHMPPKGKPQPTDEEIQAIEAWIGAGAVFGAAAGPALKPEARPAEAAPVASPSAVVPTVKVPAPDPAAIAALEAHLVHIEDVSRGSNLLRLNFGAAARTLKQEEISRLIRPVLPQLEWLSLARCPVGDETAELISSAPHLRRLDLRSSKITDAGLAALSHIATLQELVLAQTHLTDAAVPHLLACARLERVFLWKSGISAKGIESLRKQRPRLYVDAGESREAAPLAVEPDIKLTGDAPPPGDARPATAKMTAPAKPTAGAAPPQSQPAVAAAAPQSRPAASGLLSVNSICPVSGKPVNAQYTILYQGRIIGFCCPHCPSQFWADPAKFEAKLH